VIFKDDLVSILGERPFDKKDNSSDSEEIKATEEV